MSAAAIPMPVSATLIVRSPSSFAVAATATVPPSGVNLIAFEKEVQQDLIELALVRIELGQIGGDVGHQLDACRIGAGTDDRKAAGDDILEIDERIVDIDAADLGLRQIQNVVYQRQEVRAAAMDVDGIAVRLFRARA